MNSDCRAVLLQKQERWHLAVHMFKKTDRSSITPAYAGAQMGKPYS